MNDADDSGEVRDPAAGERLRQVEAIYQQVLQAEPMLRPQRLERLCGGDVKLRTEVEELLGLEEEISDFMEKPALDAAARLRARVASQSPAEGCSGAVISHYRLGEKLGEGGMGEVYLAEDTFLGRKAALKFLPEFLRRDAIAHKRFLREARSAAALDHPYICKVFEVAQTEDGRDFIAMEYVEGETLEARLARGPLSLKEAVRWGAELAEALESAHRKGIIHRDIKPSNIMLTPAGHAKIMDFGLAKRLVSDEGREQDISSALTMEGTTLGTLAYMSPEQMRGEVVDFRSDIFALGILVYEMAAGVHPFRRQQAAATAAAILRENPPPLGRYVNEVPEVLRNTVAKMLEKDPEDRYQSVHEVLTNLNRLWEDSGRESPAGGEPRWALPTWVWLCLLAAVGLVAAWAMWA